MDRQFTYFQTLKINYFKYKYKSKFIFVQLQQWIDTPKNELVYDVAKIGLTKDGIYFDKADSLASKIHSFLSRHGYINFGVFRKIHPTRRELFVLL